MADTITYTELSLPAGARDSNSHHSAICRSLKPRHVIYILTGIGVSLLVLGILLGVKGCPDSPSEADRGYEGQQDGSNRTQNLETAIKTCLGSRNAGGVCPSGWISVNGTCYFFSEDAKTWEKSHEFCSSNGAKLATVKNGSTELLCLIENLHLAYWVGLKLRGDNTSRLYQPYSWFWTPMLMSDTSGFCIMVDKAPRIHPCAASLWYVCEKKAQ